MLRNHCKGGTLCFKALDIAPVADPEAGVRHSVGILNDVTEPERSRMAIAECSARPSATCRCGVADKGIGMTAEQRARIGESVYRAAHSGKIAGTGLSMSMIEEIGELQVGGSTSPTSWAKAPGPRPGCISWRRPWLSAGHNL